jgi:hypothetical protein
LAPIVKCEVVCLTSKLSALLEPGERSATLDQISVVLPVSGSLANTCGASAPAELWPLPAT